MQFLRSHDFQTPEVGQPIFARTSEALMMITSVPSSRLNGVPLYFP
jgi:hypothetical protein